MAKTSTFSVQISQRLVRAVAAFWLLAALLIGLGLYGYYRTDLAYSQVISATEDLQSAALELNADITDEVLNTRAFLLTGEERSATRMRLAHEEIMRQLGILQELQAGKPEFQFNALETVTALHEQYDQISQKLLDLKGEGRTTQMLDTFFSQSDPLVITMQETTHDLLREIDQSRLETSLRNSRRADQLILIVAGLFLLGTVLGSGVLYLRIAPLLNRLDYFEKALVNAAETDVYHPIEIKAEDDTPPSRLVGAYNHLAQRLMDSNTTILKYVGFLHHEINSLLASVVGYGYMLSEPKVRQPDADLQEYGRVIVQQTQRITRLVDDFTMAAELEGNQFAPAMMPVRLGPLLNAVVSEVREESKRQGTSREIALIQPAEQVLVLGDALSLQSAFLKLIQNAVKFSEVEAPVEVRVEVQESPRRVLAHVQDCGIGIAPEDIGSLFRPFARIRNEATRRIPGNGMGLFIAQAIIRAHHGEISVRSKPGKGSTFTISLPLEER